MPFQPVESQRLYERVADQIGDLIRAGEVGPGQRLPAERDLAKSLGVSRPVVREAMIALEVAGLVEVRTGSGAYVREKQLGPKPAISTGNSPTDILNARMLIEGETAALAAENAGDADLEAIAGTVEDMAREQAAGRLWSPADLAFHVAIARATGNAALAGVIEQLWQQQHAPVFALMSERVRLGDNWPATISGHREVLAALLKRKPKAARRAMRAHLAQVLEVMMAETD